MPSLALSSFIDKEYSSVYAYAGVAAIKSRLTEEKAIVVLNEDDTFLGVLTPLDILLLPHHLVIDCLHDKPPIQSDQTILEVLDIMLESQEMVLPVMNHHGKLAGLLHQRVLVQHLMKENRRLNNERTTSFR